MYIIYESASFPPSDSAAIGSGYWPSLLGWMLLFLSLGLLLETLIRRGIARRKAAREASEIPADAPSPFAFRSRGMRCVYLLCGAFLVFSVILHYANYTIASIFFIPACMRTLGEKRPLRLLAVTIGMPFCVYIIFEKILGIPLPTGIYM